jgi:hypothetical protein
MRSVMTAIVASPVAVVTVCPGVEMENQDD